MDIVTKHIEEYYGNIPNDADKVEAAKHFYEQDQKYLALTWEDVQTIDNIIVDMAQHTDWPLKGKEVFYEEVLRRFNEKREKI